MINKSISREISVFQGRSAPETGILVGYGALIDAFDLQVPIPDVIALISKKNRQYRQENWQVFPPRYRSEDSLYKHLVFALKYEGVNLLLLKRLFTKLEEEDITQMILREPQGQYARRLWFLFEWLFEKQLPISDLHTGNYVEILKDSLQFVLRNGQRSRRHRIINNLPGVPEFCPLIRKTEKLQSYIDANLALRSNEYLQGINKNILQRASAFLLLKDSKASFSIEGESPKNKRAARWGKAIGQAGFRDLNLEELIRLQQIVIESERFVKMGLRKKGGFIGEHDRTTGEPLPDHISARQTDLEGLISGLTDTSQKLLNDAIDPVIAATAIAFGFVFIHPFIDGNGRLHRYLIHHVLAKKKFVQQGIIFPVSASILNHIGDYRNVLEHYSSPLLDLIEWKETSDHNVEVTNDSIDFYRYFDATAQAEFLYACVHDTIENIIPEELQYLIRYDQFKRYAEDEFEMPDKTISLLTLFLHQNNGRLSKRARENEFASLKNSEVMEIEKMFSSIFKDE